MDELPDIKRMQEIQFAQTNGELDAEARGRMKERLTQDRNPVAAASSSSWVDWSLESDYLGKPFDATNIPLSKLEQMRRDPILAFALMFVKTPLIRAPWHIKCADPKIAAAVDASLRKIYGRFILAYCNSLDFGFSPMVKRFEYDEKPDWVFVDKDNPEQEEQPVWTLKTVKPIVWKPFTALNPRRCTPHWNSKGEFNGIDFAQSGFSNPFYTSGYPSSQTGYEYAGSAKRVADIPLSWALWATNEKDSVFGSYWGYPRIGHAYRFWWSYWYRFGVADRAFEKWGDPPMVVYHPDDPLAVDSAGNPVNFTDTALGLAESARSGANVALPGGVVTSFDERPTGIREWEIFQLQTKTDFGAIGDTFRYLDIQKLRAVMVPEQALIEGEGGTSSRNVASTFGELFQEAQAVVKQEIDDHLNRWVIPQFVDLNFGPTAPRASIVTDGFDQMDLDTMASVLQLVGQRQLLSVIDERELAERMGVPTVSRKEFKRRMDELAKEAEAAKPQPIQPQSGPNNSSGVNADGHYYAPRDRIVLGHNTTLPYVVERVDVLPEEAAAFFDTSTRTLHVLKDADPSAVTGYLLGLTEQLKQEGTPIPDDIDQVLAEFKQLSEDVRAASVREPKVQVEFQQPDKEDPTIYKTRRRVTERDERGFIVDSEEWKEKIKNENEDGGKDVDPAS
jgi:hypothetical protein